jgi:hypothetical protein
MKREEGRPEERDIICNIGVPLNEMRLAAVIE